MIVPTVVLFLVPCMMKLAVPIGELALNWCGLVLSGPSTGGSGCGSFSCGLASTVSYSYWGIGAGLVITSVRRSFIH